eukprot:6281171-Prymnesium_polylepis.1
MIDVNVELDQFVNQAVHHVGSSQTPKTITKRMKVPNTDSEFEQQVECVRHRLRSSLGPESVVADGLEVLDADSEFEQQ